ncbi:DUF3445 domain-containing protein [Pontibrevibacter nitratireducens]|uniref:DUF3445 domain-containing protein n=2 Tax=Pontivivens nitratireducens TaxID=2758038 RepID=A0A6G7VND6_9RHOB|nr:DUF3445 domain-containing protein [Pontibrevibacter nitratireducens]
MPLILQHPEQTPWMKPATRRNPGVQPLDPHDWLQRDACHADQMALRNHLIDTRREQVFGCGDDMAPSVEVCELVGRTLGVDIPPDGDHPLIRAAQQVQEDLLILQRQGKERQGKDWVLTDGVLCFPSHWTLSQKLGRPLDAIHEPVPFYAGDLARRVQRLFDAIRVEQPLWRANWLIYPDADLFHPRREYEEKRADWSGELYIRVERQSLVKLPQTGAIVFSIKTDICPLGGLSTAQRTGLLAAFDDLPPVQRAYKGGDRVRALLT